MSAAGTPSPISNIFQTLLSTLKADVVSSVGGLLDTMFDNIIKSPTPATVVAQGGILVASALLAAPSLEGPVLTQIAQSGKALVAAGQVALAST